MTSLKFMYLYILYLFPINSFLRLKICTYIASDRETEYKTEYIFIRTSKFDKTFITHQGIQLLPNWNQ